jgi:hypothetical protein
VVLAATLLAAMPPAAAAGHGEVIPMATTSFTTTPIPPRPRLELTPFAGGRLGGSFDSTGDDGATTRISVEDDSSFGLIVNFPSTWPTEWELVYSQQSTALDRRSPGDLRPLDLDISYLHAGGLYLFEGELAQPYIAATLGVTRLAPDEGDFRSETKFSFALGAGYKLFPARRFGLRLDARIWGTVLDSNSGLFCRSGPEEAGCQVRASGSMLWQWELAAGGILRF